MSVRLLVLSALLAVAAACGKTYSPTDPNPTPSPNPDPGGPSVTIPAGAEVLGNRAYSPDEFTINAGQSVTWTNDDAVTHTTTSDSSGWNSGNVPPGGHFTAMFPTAGTFSYHCQIHPGMVGKITVR